VDDQSRQAADETLPRLTTSTDAALRQSADVDRLERRRRRDGDPGDLHAVDAYDKAVRSLSGGNDVQSVPQSIVVDHVRLTDHDSRSSLESSVGVVDARHAVAQLDGDIRVGALDDGVGQQTVRLVRAEQEADSLVIDVPDAIRFDTDVAVEVRRERYGVGRHEGRVVQRGRLDGDRDPRGASGGRRPASGRRVDEFTWSHVVEDSSAVEVKVAYVADEGCLVGLVDGGLSDEDLIDVDGEVFAGQET